jgi:hypothetical protein
MLDGGGKTFAGVASDRGVATNRDTIPDTSASQGFDLSLRDPFGVPEDA